MIASKTKHVMDTFLSQLVILVRVMWATLAVVASKTKHVIDTFLSQLVILVRVMWATLAVVASKTKHVIDTFLSQLEEGKLSVHPGSDCKQN